MDNTKPEYFAVIEAGGTKFNCAIIDAERTIYSQIRIATTIPKETLAKVVAFFREQRQRGFEFAKLGLACFGPLDLNPHSAHFGSITATPKLHWSHTNIVDYFQRELGCQVVLDTDVNAAALAEYRWGAAQGSSVSIYLTVGTGIGGGVVINGQPLHGLIHPEIGHMLLPAPEGIEGCCPFHGNCAEGLASGTSLGKIWRQPAETLDDSHPAWDIQAQVLARLCHNLILAYSTEKIVLGGGVMGKPGLVANIVKYTAASLADYVVFPPSLSLKDIIVSPGLGQHSGLFGALALLIAET